MIYIDANILVYALMDFASKGKAARELMRYIDEETVEAATCSLTMDEIMWVFIRAGRKDSLKKAITGFYESNLRILPVSKQAPLNACTIIEECGLAPRDAIHAAVMKENHLKEMVSEDKGFDSLNRFKRYSLKDFLELDKEKL